MMTSKYSFRYTDEQIDYLREGYMVMSAIKLAAKFNAKFKLDKTPEQIKGILKARNIKCGRGTGDLMKGRSKLFNDEQIKFIEENYGPKSRKELLNALNEKFDLSIKLSQLVSFVKNRKIKSGRTGHFKKGVPSWSSGTRGILKANSASFKKGHVPHNWVPVGSERINSAGYHEKKIAEPNYWVGKHILLWQGINGAIPDNHNVRFKDGDKNNIRIENLILVNKSEHQYMTLNKLNEQPKEVQDTVILLSRDQAKTIKLEKEGEA